MSSSSAARSIPRYRSAALSSRLPPAKLPLFRSVVSHPPAPFAVEAAQRAAAAAQAQAEAEDKGNGKVRSAHYQRAVERRSRRELEEEGDEEDLEGFGASEGSGEGVRRVWRSSQLRLACSAGYGGSCGGFALDGECRGGGGLCSDAGTPSGLRRRLGKATV